MQSIKHKSQSFDYIFINTEDNDLRSYADNNVDFYLRDYSLATSTASSDQVVYDAFHKLHPDIDLLVWINTASPLTTVEDIQSFIHHVELNNSMSAVAVRRRGHLFYNNKPLNFGYTSGFERTQDILPAYEFNYSMMAWHRDYIPTLKRGILFDESTTMFESSWYSNLLLKESSDMIVIEQVYKAFSLT